MDEARSPKQLTQEGNSAYKRGDYLAAARAFEAASQGYAAAGNKLEAAEAANNCSVAYLQAEAAEAALKAVEGSEEVFAQAGDLRRQGMAVGNRAAALEALERLDEAAQAYRQSADLLQEAGEDKLRANALQSLSMLQFRTGRQLQALATMQDGVEGVKHPSAKQKFLKRLLKIPFEMMKNKS